MDFRKKRGLTIFVLFLLFHSAFSQKGKDGAETITAPGVIFNRYTTLTQSAVAGNSFIVVASMADLSGSAIPGPGNPFSADGLEGCDLLMIIKMQGASINAGNTSAYGTVTNYRGVGDYELIEAGVIMGNTINLANGCVLNNSYTISPSERVQVIRIPRLTTLTINNGASLVSRPWGQVANTGGIVAIETSGAVIINGSVSVQGQGYRGGAATSSVASPAVTNYVGVSGILGGEKGEGIAGYQADYDLLGGRYARGAPANGGGGGNSNNAGGGGGANAGSLLGYTGSGNPDNTGPGWTAAWNLESPGFATSSSPGGGRGGYTKSLNDASALTQGPGNAAWGGDNRNNTGGLGGRPLDYAANTKLFFGGGGGAGHGDNGFNQDGGDGGGIIYFTSDGSISGSGVVTANGENALPTVPAHTDGPGGGGGGGSVCLFSGTSITGGLQVTANGGKGGDQLSAVAEAEGPGGGGGGGYIFTTVTGITTLVNGGANGTTTSPSLSEFTPNGATYGAAGAIVNNTPYANNSAKTNLGLSILGNTVVCINTQKTYSVVVINQACNTASNIIVNLTPATGINYTLSSPSAGTYVSPSWTIPSLSPNASATLVLTGAITSTNVSVFSGTAISLTSYECNTANNTTISPSFTVIQTNIIATAIPSVICVGAVSTLTSSGADTYTWQPGNMNGNTNTVSPGSTTIYTVNGTYSTCPGTQTVQLIVNPNPTLTAISLPTFMCAGEVGTLTAGGAIGYTWYPGSLTGPTQTITAYGTVEYTVVGINAFGCTSQTVTTLSAFSPTITVYYPPFCKGESVTVTAFGGDTYTWTPGNIISPTISVITPTATQFFTVTSTHSTGCIGKAFVAVGAVPLPTVTAIATPTGICPGGTSLLQAYGAATYYWMPPLNVSDYTVVVSPPTTTVYTVIGYNIAGCADTATVQLTVYPEPTVVATADPHSICRGNSTTLTATGANSYTWLPPIGIVSPTVVVSPSTTIIYTVVGTNTYNCYDSDTVLVRVGPDITASAIPSVICSGQSSTLSASGGTVYTWDPGGINGQSLVVTPSITTIYTVTATDIIGCTGTATVRVRVNPTPSVTAIASPTSICAGEGITLTALPGTDTYFWQPGNYTGSLVTTFLNSTTVFTVVSTNTDNCSDTKTVQVTVNNCTVVVPIGISKKASVPESDGHDDFYVTFSFTVKNYTSFPIYNVQIIDDLTQTFPPPSTYTIINSPVSSSGGMQTNNGYTGNGNNTHLLVPNTNSLLPGQADTIKVRIKVSPNGVKSFTNSAVATASSLPVGGFGGSDVSDDGSDPDPDKDNNPSGIDEDTPTVFDFESEFFIPQGFSPNGDGVNDFFVIRGIKYYPNNAFTVLNRWGNVVYKTSGYANTWDGTTEEGIKIGGNNLPEGTYYYILDLGNGSKAYKGFLYLTRGINQSK